MRVVVHHRANSPVASGAAASRLAARLGPGWVAQDFRACLPQPAPQTPEVWLTAG
jgi:hypothetical protein